MANIDRDKAFDRILELLPEFKDDWKAHLQDWGHELPGITNDMGAFAHYVARLVDRSDFRRTKIALDAIELFLTEGDADLQYGVSLGFLEGFTNMLLTRNPKTASNASSYFGPNSLEFCRQLDDFWGTNTPGVVRE